MLLFRSCTLNDTFRLLTPLMPCGIENDGMRIVFRRVKKVTPVILMPLITTDCCGSAT
jgi:hypothetical protein